MAVVRSVVKDDNDEITGATVMKGSNREVVKRHSSTLIPLLQYNNATDDDNDSESCDDNIGNAQVSRNSAVRKAAKESRLKTRNILTND